MMQTLYVITGSNPTRRLRALRPRHNRRVWAISTTLTGQRVVCFRVNDPRGDAA